MPLFGRNPSAQLIRHNHAYFLIDCGEGTQMQLRRYKLPLARINHIFISHLHGDHFFGLAGLVSTMHLMNRTHPLQIFCQKGLKELMEHQFRVSDTWLRFPIEFTELDSSATTLIFENDTLQVFSFPLKHRIPCCGFRLEEKPRPRPLIKEAVIQHGIPPELIPALRRGEDVVLSDGTLIKNDRVTTLPPKSMVYSYCSDTAFDAGIADAVRNSSLLYCESTFLEEHRQRAGETLHSTASDAARLAVESSSAQLLIGHFSARYKELQGFIDEASAVFPQVKLAREGEAYAVEDFYRQMS